MSPTLFNGEILIYRSIKYHHNLLAKGSIVVAIDPLEAKTLIVKRIYKITSSGIELRGDNKSNSIDSRQFGIINPKNIKGIVEMVVR